MHKTFKKSIACLLAALMILTTMPFTAFAAQHARQWWVDDGIDPATITEEPVYAGFNHPDNDEGLSFGDQLDPTSVSDYRDNYKPVLGVTVTNIGTNGQAGADLAKVWNTYYGFNATKDYDTVDAAGNILNPAELKAGQRIAVTIEMGGFDMFLVGQIKGYFDNTKIVPAYYTKSPKSADTWTHTTEANGTNAWVKTGAHSGVTCINYAGKTTDPDVGGGRGSYYIAMTGEAAQGGMSTTSNFLGTGIDDPYLARPFGKYGVVCGVIEFEVLQDCDFTEAFEFETRDMPNLIEGTQLRTHSPEIVDDGLTEIAFGNSPDTYANPTIIWSKYEKAAAPTHTHSFEGATPVADNAGNHVYTCTAADCPGGEGSTKTEACVNSKTWENNTATCGQPGTIVEITTCQVCGYQTRVTKDSPATGLHEYGTWTHDATTENAASTHSRACTVCGGDKQTANCSFSRTVVTDSDYTNEGLARYTCADCGYSYDEAIPVKVCDHATTATREENVTAPTCGVAGSKDVVTYCTVCNKDLSTETGVVIPATEEHTTTTRDVNVTPATCGAAGSKDIETYCTACGKVISTETGVEIPATEEHTTTTRDVVVTPATCGAAGVKNIETYCTACNKVISTQEGVEIPATGEHTMSAWTHDATTGGKIATHSRACSACGGASETENCSFTYAIVIPATETKEGLGRYTCSVCDYSYDVAIAKVDCAHADTVIQNAKPATCTEAGYTGDTYCNVCKQTIATGTATEVLGHDMTKVVTAAKAATCTEAGNKEQLGCTRCDVVNALETIEALGHDMTKVVTEAKAPTCAEAGNEEQLGCTRCNVVNELVTLPATGEHTAVSADNAVAPTLDAPGKEADTVCSVCGALIAEGAEIPALKGYTVTVEPVDLGATTLDGADATNGATKKVVANSTVELTATPVEGAEFVGWMVGNMMVSTELTYVDTVVANVTITPVFATTAADEFTVIFMDSYGNVISTQTVANGADIVEPQPPARTGYKFTKWSMTAAEIDALTEGATIMAEFTKDVEKTYTVTATGCTITVDGVEYNDVATGITYNTKVTVTKAGTDVWTIDGVEAAYGETYSFYVGADVEVVPHVDETAVPMPTVANVSKTAVAGTTKYTYLATRSVPDGYSVVSSGFIYGKNVDTDPTKMILDNVGTNGYRATYITTSAAQFSVTVGCKSTGVVSVRAFIVCKNAKGETLAPIYADVVSHSY